MKQMNNVVIYVFILLKGLSIYSQSETPTKNQFEFTKTITSTFLNEKRSFTIKLPINYYTAKEEKFPVLYVLDAKNLKEHTYFIHNFLSRKGHIPKMIIVSIPHTGKRNRDYKTYFRDTDKINEGANHFLNFLEKEVIAYVNNEYRTTNYKLLSGHSNSGLFVIHTLIKKPTLFNARFAFSPSSHHIPAQRKLLKTTLINNRDINSYFYMNVGGAEFYKMKDAFAEVKQIFEEYAPEKLRYNFDIHDVDGHQTTPFIGQHTAFKKLYAPFKLRIEDYESLSYIELVKHFENASLEFGYPIIPKERDLVSMGNYYVNFVPRLIILKKLIKLIKRYYPTSKLIGGNSLFYENWLAYGTQKKIKYTETLKPDEIVVTNMGRRYLSKGKFTEAFYLFKLSVELYPTSSIVFNNLGGAYEKFGDFKRALKMYKKAYTLGKKANEKEENITIHLKNIKKIKDKIKTKIQIRKY